MRKEFEMLKNHSDVRAQFRQINTRSTDIDPIYENAAALERLKGVDGLNQSGFSGAGRPADNDNFAFFDRCGAIAENLKVSVPLADIFYLDHRHSRISHLI